MLLKKEDSCVLVVDIQERLIKTIYEYQRLLANCDWLLRVANTLNVPIVVSEQYPQGLGRSVPELMPQIKNAPVMEKVHFSCSQDNSCLAKIQGLNKEQVVIMGIESHVCVMQTAIGLKQCGFAVFIAKDCISARDPENTALALARMQQFGIQIVSREMVMFEWLEQAATPLFKAMSKEFLQSPLLL